MTVTDVSTIPQGPGGQRLLGVDMTEIHALVGALQVAVLTYRDAAEAAQGVPRVHDQFITQAQSCERLLETLETAV